MTVEANSLRSAFEVAPDTELDDELRAEMGAVEARMNELLASKMTDTLTASLATLREQFVVKLPAVAVPEIPTHDYDALLPAYDRTPGLLEAVIERLDHVGEVQASTVVLLEALAGEMQRSNRSQTRRFWITLPLAMLAAASAYPLLERIFG